MVEGLASTKIEGIPQSVSLHIWTNLIMKCEGLEALIVRVYNYHQAPSLDSGIPSTG